MIELVMVIAIIAITACIAVSGLIVLMPKLSLNAVARDVSSNFHRAKIEAVKRNLLCTITFNILVNGHIYDYVVYIDSDQDLEYDAGEAVIKAVRFSDYKGSVGFDVTKGNADGLTFEKNDDNKPSVGFNPRGLPINNSGGFGIGSVYLKNARGNTRQISVSPAGRISID
ncbi:GspH/FimT family protein [bacterium]|nr:GspH/FimT family protein [bacterium]